MSFEPLYISAAPFAEAPQSVGSQRVSLRGQILKHLLRSILKTRDGNLIQLAGDIIQKDYADWLADEIKDTLGIVADK